MRLVPYNPLEALDHYGLCFLIILAILWFIHEYCRWVYWRNLCLRLEKAHGFPVDFLATIAWEHLGHFRVTKKSGEKDDLILKSY